MNSVLVTGCAGFIGSTLCEKLLRDGYRVIGLDNFDPFYPRIVKESNLQTCKSNSNFSFYEIDIANKVGFGMLTEPVDTVIHVAAKAGVRPSIHDPIAYINANIIGTQNVLDWMLERNVRKLVFTSSSSIYGNNTPVPFSESANVDHPISPYAFTKKACELLNHTYHSLYNFDIINLRLFTVYGERQRPDLAIHKFVDAIYNNRPITMFGEGESLRDYTYVKDIVAGIVSAHHYILNNKKVFEIINLGNSNPVSLKKLIELLSEIIGKEAIITKEGKQPGDMDFTYADISKAKKLLGYEPKTEIRQGLENFIKWYTGFSSVPAKK
jgi:UDP-glucuronate 4-epimerase